VGCGGLRPPQFRSASLAFLLSRVTTPWRSRLADAVVTQHTEGRESSSRRAFSQALRDGFGQGVSPIKHIRLCRRVQFRYHVRTSNGTEIRDGTFPFVPCVV
jgi:hypothetical protein